MLPGMLTTFTADLRYGKQPVGRNKLAKIIPDKWKQAGIDWRKTGHSGKVTRATTLHRQNFEDQLIKEYTGHRSLEVLHKYKHTESDQQYEVSMAQLPMINSKLGALDKESTIEKPASDGKENKPGEAVKPTCKSNSIKPNAVFNSDDKDDLKPMKKRMEHRCGQNGCQKVGADVSMYRSSMSI